MTTPNTRGSWSNSYDLDVDSTARFDALFQLANQRLKKLVARVHDPSVRPTGLDHAEWWRSQKHGQPLIADDPRS
jgi:hypothetical protein